MSLFIFEAFKCLYKGGVEGFSVKDLHSIRSRSCCRCGKKVYPTEMMGNAWVKENNEYKILCYQCRKLKDKFNTVKLADSVVLPSMNIMKAIILARCQKCNSKLDPDAIVQGIRFGGSAVNVRCDNCLGFLGRLNECYFSCGECGALNSKGSKDKCWNDERCWSCNLEHKHRWFYDLPYKDEQISTSENCAKCEKGKAKKDCSMCNGYGFVFKSYELPQLLSYMKMKYNYTDQDLTKIMGVSDSVMSDILKGGTTLTHGQVQKLIIDVEKEPVAEKNL